MRLNFMIKYEYLKFMVKTAHYREIKVKQYLKWYQNNHLQADRGVCNWPTCRPFVSARQAELPSNPAATTKKGMYVLTKAGRRYCNIQMNNPC